MYEDIFKILGRKEAHNKYQESLNRVSTAIYRDLDIYRNYTQSSVPFEEDIAVLQELIDKFELLESEKK